MLQVARTIGMGTARIAEANRELVIRTLTQPGDTERDLANRFAAAAEHLLPLVGPTLVYAFQANMLEQIRRDVIGAADLASGEIGGAVEMTVCFADLVEFTRLGEEIAPEELGLVAGRLEEMATAVAEPPVRLVKTIGDAVMLVSAEPEPLIEAALALIAAAEAEGEEFPWLRAGLACGADPAAGRRLLRPLGQPGQPDHRRRPSRQRLVDAATREAAGEGFAYSYVGERRLKGIDSRVKLFRRAASPARWAAPREPALGGLAAGDEQVVEELGRQPRLEQARCRPSAGRCSCGRRSGASAAGPIPARRSTRPCAAPSPRRWRAAPRRRRGAPRSRRRASSCRRSAGAKAWTSTSPSSAWPLGLLGLGHGAARGRRSGAARPGRRAMPARFGSAARRSP